MLNFLVGSQFAQVGLQVAALLVRLQFWKGQRQLSVLVFTVVVSLVEKNGALIVHITYRCISMVPAYVFDWQSTPWWGGHALEPHMWATPGCDPWTDAQVQPWRQSGRRWWTMIESDRLTTLKINKGQSLHQLFYIQLVTKKVIMCVHERWS